MYMYNICTWYVHIYIMCARRCKAQSYEPHRPYTKSSRAPGATSPRGRRLQAATVNKYQNCANCGCFFAVSGTLLLCYVELSMHAFYRVDRGQAETLRPPAANCIRLKSFYQSASCQHVFDHKRFNNQSSRISW